MKRCSGVLLPIFSLPSPYGIGTLGKAAYDWIDFLHEAGQQLWQVLPIGPTSFGDSPYQSFSAFAGNPYFIDLEQLCEDGLLQKEDCAPLADQADSAAIDYAKQYQYRYAILKKAYSRFDNPNEISRFRKAHNLSLIHISGASGLRIVHDLPHRQAPVHELSAMGSRLNAAPEVYRAAKLYRRTDVYKRQVLVSHEPFQEYLQSGNPLPRRYEEEHPWLCCLLCRALQGRQN